MKKIDTQNSNADLEKELKDLRRQIEKLTLLLAFRELEAKHPVLRKTADAVESRYKTAKTAVEHLAHGANIEAKGLFTKIMALASCGYLVAYLLSHVISGKRK